VQKAPRGGSDPLDGKSKGAPLEPQISKVNQVKRQEEKGPDNLSSKKNRHVLCSPEG